MDFELFTHIIDENPGINRLSLNNWGESLAHKEIFQMIEYAKEKDIKTILLCTIINRFNSFSYEPDKFFFIQTICKSSNVIMS